MNIKLFFSAFVLSLLLTGLSNAFSQETIKSRKEREEFIGRELGLNKEQSAQLVEQQEKYDIQVSQILKDKALIGPQRGAKLRALSVQHAAALKKLLNPEQQKKIADAMRKINVSNPALKAVTARFQERKGKSLKADSNQVKIKQ